MRWWTRSHGVVAASLLIVAVVAVLGHICVLPLHAHAVPIEGRGSHDEDTAGDSVHTASCDALKTASPTRSITPVVAATTLAVAEPAAPCGFDEARAVAHAKSPPLFLLHAALLI